MFLDPAQAIQEGWITFPSWMDAELKGKCVQPNAIDFTLDRVFQIKSHNIFAISESAKLMRGTTEKLPVPFTEGSGWVLHEGVYDVMSDFFVKLPKGVAALLVPRSTFVRNGLFWISGLYDSGFEGHIGGVLHNPAGQTQISRGTRVGQIIFIPSEGSDVYAGGWNHQQGTHYAETK